MTMINQGMPALPLSLSPIEEGDQTGLRAPEEVKEEIRSLESEIKDRQDLIAASSRTSRRKDTPGIDLNKLVANGSGKVIEEARKKIAVLNKELENILAAKSEKVSN